MEWIYQTVPSAIPIVPSALPTVPSALQTLASAPETEERAADRADLVGGASLPWPVSLPRPTAGGAQTQWGLYASVASEMKRRCSAEIAFLARPRAL